MKRKLVLYLPRGERLFVYIQLLWIMIMLWLRDVAGFPSAIAYLTDIILAYILIMNINSIRRENHRACTKTQVRIFYAIMLASLFGVIINLVSPMLVVWAARNNFRFFLFFFACIGMLSVDDVDRIIELLFRFFWINMIVCTVQYFGQGLYGDYLGGLFGTEKGSNTYTNILLCAITSVIFGRYFYGKISMIWVGTYTAACVYLAILSELKAFYFEIVIILIVSMIMAGVRWKVVFMGIAGVLGVQILLLTLSIHDPRALITFFDPDALEAYLIGDGYTQSGDLNRFTAIGQIYNMFYEKQPLKVLFGFGLGSCETSRFSFLQSDFAHRYEYLHYRWFTHAWVFLEQGAVGLFLLCLFFVSLLFVIQGRRGYIRTDLAISSGCYIMTSIFGMIYNSALQMESGYIIALMCAIPFIASKANIGEKTRDMAS